MICVFFFFFQAEDGIRDGHVTGVQTCALPISWPGVGQVSRTVHDVWSIGPGGIGRTHTGPASELSTGSDWSNDGSRNSTSAVVGVVPRSNTTKSTVVVPELPIVALRRETAGRVCGGKTIGNVSVESCPLVSNASSRMVPRFVLDRLMNQ